MPVCPGTPMADLLQAATKFLETSRREEQPFHCTAVQTAGRSRRLAEIALELIDPDPDQVRQQNNLNTEDFAEMCANVAEHGVLQPLLLRRAAVPGRYLLIAGEFRLEAARQAGLTSLPCYIEDSPIDMTELRLLQLSENLHRQSLSHLDLARAFHWLTLPEGEGGGLRAVDLARRLGKSEAFVSEHKKLLLLSAEDQQQMEEGKLSYDQARMKLRLQANRQRGEKIHLTTADWMTESTPTDQMAPTANRSTQPSGERLDNGNYVYSRYSGSYPETSLTVTVSGPDPADPELDCVVRAVERHLHFLKIKQRRHHPIATQGK